MRARHILQLLADHEAYRRGTLNLIAAENAVSPSVRATLNSDLVQRYADYSGRDLRARRYRGNRYIVRLEETVAALAAETFRARHVEVRPLGGHLAGIAVLTALCRPGDVILELDREAGGHREAGRFESTGFPGLTVRGLPFDGQRYNVDAAAAVREIRATRPRLIILGSSNFLFPHPVQEIASAAHKVGGLVAYDGSHVLGFLAAKLFQEPLVEGADVVFGSTHKTFPGPQGGIVFSNDGDLMEMVSAALVPALVTNHHPFRMPGLALALLEMRRWGRAYMEQTRTNAQALGELLEGMGVPCIAVDGKFTESHTILLKVSEFGSAPDVAGELEDAGIIVTHATLPASHGGEGIRIGTQEITRLGAQTSTVTDVARLITAVLRRSRSPESIGREVAELATSLGPTRYTWPMVAGQLSE